MTSRLDHADGDTVDDDPFRWKMRLERHPRGEFLASLTPPEQTVAALVRPAELADPRKIRATVFAQTGYFIPEGDFAQLRRILPQITADARREFEIECVEAGIENPFAPAAAKAIEFVTAAQLAERSSVIEYAVDGILAKGQPAILGGPMKSLKTTLALDLAVSLSTGSSFLGKFDVLHRGHVAFLSAESGEATIRETGRRICRAKGYDLRSINALFCFEAIKLSRASEVAALRKFVISHGVEYLFIDPAYLLLLAGDTSGKQASSVFDMGAALWPLTELGQATGVTTVLLHHTRKSAGKDGEQIGLGDLAFSGFAEWARQWLLLRRLAEYEPGSGRHDLQLEVGGSAGHSGRWAVTVDEGAQEDGRTYEVTVSSMFTHYATERAKREDLRSKQEREKLAAHAEKVADVLRERFPEGATKNSLREWTSLSGTALTDAIQHMLSEGLIVEIELPRKNGKWPGYKLTRTNPDEPGLLPGQSAPGLTRTRTALPVGEPSGCPGSPNNVTRTKGALEACPGSKPPSKVEANGHAEALFQSE